MNILIAYGSKTGTAADCAAMLAEKLKSHDVTMVNLKNDKPDPADYDIIVIGGSVRMGMLHKATTEYIKSNEQKLADTKAAYFICCADSEQFDYYAEKAIPVNLLKNAVSFMCFGGELRPERCHGIEKLFVKAMRRSIINSNNEVDIDEEDKKTMPSIIPENIAVMADAIKVALK